MPRNSTTFVLWGKHPAHGPHWLKLCDYATKKHLQYVTDGWYTATRKQREHPDDKTPTRPKPVNLIPSGTVFGPSGQSPE